MPFRRKSRNTVSRQEKENAAVAEPLSPRLIRCRSDNTQRTCSEISLNKSLTNQAGALSAEAKMSNLMQLNSALVKEVASLRMSHADAKTLAKLDLLKDELSQFSNEKDALLSDKQRLLEKIVGLEAHISSVNSEKTMLAEQLQAAQKAHATDKQGFLAELKKMERAVSDLEVEQSDLLKQLNVEKMAVAAAQDSIASLESTKQELLQEKFERRSRVSEQLAVKEKALADAENHISSLHDEAQKLRLLNGKVVEQAASLKKQVTYIEAVNNGLSSEVQTMLAKIKQMEIEISELSSSKKALQQKLEDDQSEAMEKLSIATCKLTSLHQLKGSIEMSNKQLSEELAVLKGEKLQLKASVSELHAKLKQSLEKIEVEKTSASMSQTKQLSEMEQLHKENDILKASVSELHAKLEQSLEEIEAEKTSANILQTKQLSEMEQLRKENDKLTSANSGLMSSIKMSESQGKQWMSEKKKKDEQHVFLSKLYADLEASHTALENELGTLKADSEALARDNAVLQSSIETKARAIVMLELQLDESTKNCSSLESQIEAISVLLKSSQEDLNAQYAAVDAEKAAKASLCSTLQMKTAVIERLEEQLREGALRIAQLSTQLETNLARENEVKSMVSSLKEELSMAHKTAAHIEEQAKAKLDGTIALKNEKLSKLKGQLNEASLKKSELGCKLKACNEKKSQLELQVKKSEAELVTVKAVALKAEEELKAAVKFEGDFNEASKRILLLEAQLRAKATMQNDLEFKVISLKNDLHAAQAASEKAEKEWKANMDTVLDNANARSRGLEEQLESVKKTLCEMQNNANRGQESLVSLQTQLSCLMEEKSSLEKKAALSTNSSSMEQEEPSAEEERVKEGSEAQKAKAGLDEKSKLVRLVLPVFLITTASSMVFAGIQNYIRRLEN